MVDVGSIIRAKVTRVEPYGVFLEHAEGPVAVLLPEVSWSDRRPLHESIRPGEEYDVLVLRYNYRDRVMAGSIRRLQPNQNPYRQLAGLEPGTPLRWRVVNVFDHDLTVELPNGAWGHVPKRPIAATVQCDDEIDLVISAIEVDEGRLTLEPIAADAPHANGSAASIPAKSNVQGARSP